jgi:hypothetical protein
MDGSRSRPQRPGRILRRFSPNAIGCGSLVSRETSWIRRGQLASWPAGVGNLLMPAPHTPALSLTEGLVLSLACEGPRTARLEQLVLMRTVGEQTTSLGRSAPCRRPRQTDGPRRPRDWSLRSILRRYETVTGALRFLDAALLPLT